MVTGANFYIVLLDAIDFESDFGQILVEYLAVG